MQSVLYDLYQMSSTPIGSTFTAVLCLYRVFLSVSIGLDEASCAGPVPRPHFILPLDCRPSRPLVRRGVAETHNQCDHEQA